MFTLLALVIVFGLIYSLLPIEQPFKNLVLLIMILIVLYYAFSLFGFYDPFWATPHAHHVKVG